MTSIRKQNVEDLKLSSMLFVYTSGLVILKFSLFACERIQKKVSEKMKTIKCRKKQNKIKKTPSSVALVCQSICTGLGFACNKTKI